MTCFPNFLSPLNFIDEDEEEEDLSEAEPDNDTSLKMKIKLKKKVGGVSTAEVSRPKRKRHSRRYQDEEPEQDEYEDVYHYQIE